MNLLGIVSLLLLCVGGPALAVFLDRYLARRWHDDTHLPDSWHPQP